MSVFWPIETAVNLFLQSLGDWLIPIMKIFSFFGQEEFYLLIMSALYWCFDASMGIRIGITLVASNALNGWLKIAFHGARPYWLDSRVRAITAETSYGFPSGHSMNAAAIWGQIAYSLKKSWGYIAAFILIIFIGLSRIFLGVHFLSDVIGGWSIGLILLLVINGLEKPVINYWTKQSLFKQICISIFSSLLIPFIAWAILELRGNWVMPESWFATALSAAPDDPIAPDQLSGLISLSGTWMGLLIGVALTARTGGFHATGTGRLKILRYLVGVIGVMVFWYGLGAFFPRGEYLFAFFLRYLRYGLTGFWITFGAVWFFRKFHLS